jgi:hypothetical protein
MSRECSTYEQNRNAYRVLVRKPERKTPLGRPRHRWEDSIKIDLIEIRWGGIGWIYLWQDRDQWQAVMNMVINLRVP